MHVEPMLEAYAMGGVVTLLLADALWVLCLVMALASALVVWLAQSMMVAGTVTCLLACLGMWYSQAIPSLLLCHYIYSDLMTITTTNTTTQPKLFLAMAMGQWNDILAWIAFSPHEVSSTRDVLGHATTALHQAILCQAPFHVVDSLLWVAPELAAIANADGDLPLHWAVRLSAEPSILELLQRAKPETAFWKDHFGNSPVSLHWERHQRTILERWRCGCCDGAKRMDESDLAWSRCMSFFRAVHVDDVDDDHKETNPQEARAQDDSPLLHIAATLPLPLGLFPLMMQVYKPSLSTRDGRGRLPLTIACQHPVANRFHDLETKIHLLVREFPESVHWRDAGTGRLPLHDALDSGIPWDEGIGCLMKAFPSSMSLRDPISLLFPFALAATPPSPPPSSTTTTTTTTVTVPDEALESSSDWKTTTTTIYRLLRNDPSVLAASHASMS